jgi:hypothetical protein
MRLSSMIPERSLSRGAADRLVIKSWHLASAAISPSHRRGCERDFESAKLNGLDPQHYLADALARIRRPSPPAALRNSDLELANRRTATGSSNSMLGSGPTTPQYYPQRSGFGRGRGLNGRIAGDMTSPLRHLVWGFVPTRRAGDAVMHGRFAALPSQPSRRDRARSGWHPGHQTMSRTPARSGGPKRHRRAGRNFRYGQFGIYPASPIRSGVGR